jgi:hypothetical protein
MVVYFSNLHIYFRFTVTYDTDSEYKIEAINDVKQTPSADNSSWKMRTELGPIETGKVL